MANDEVMREGSGASAGERTPPSDGLSISSFIDPEQTQMEGENLTIMQSRLRSDHTSGAQAQPSGVQQPSSGPKSGISGSLGGSKMQDAEFQKFFKSVEARIDPNDPPNLLLTEPDLLNMGRIQIGAYTCPLVDQIALIKKLGEGGNGSVYLGYQHRFGEVALKTLKIKIVQNDPSMVGRFFLEANLSKKFTSNHIVKTYDARSEGELNFLVMEYVTGTDASGYLKKLKSRSKDAGATAAVPEKETLKICIAACKGLQALHDAGVMHRDIKPQNIMVPHGKDKELDFEASKLMDLGLAKNTDEDAPSILRKDDGNTVQGTLLGTPGFMAPEQIIDCSHVSAAADIFSMGATLYALMCGSPPFRDVQGPLATASATIHGDHIPIAERCMKAKIQISKGMATVIEQCLRKKVIERYNNASELLADLERVYAGQSPLAKRRPRKGLYTKIAIGVAAAALVITAAVMYKSDGTKRTEIGTLLVQANEAADKYEFELAKEFKDKATLIRVTTSSLSKDGEIDKREAEFSLKLLAAKEKFGTYCDEQVKAFRVFTKAEEYEKANAALDTLKHHDQHLPEKLEKLKDLQAELDAAKKATQIRKEQEERARIQSRNNAIRDAEMMLAKGNFAEADKHYRDGLKFDGKDATPALVQLGIDIPRNQRVTQIESLLKDGKSDLKSALVLVDEIKGIDAKNTIIPELTSRISTEQSRRSLVAVADEKLAKLAAGAGDLAEANDALSKLAATDPDRTKRETTTAKLRAEFDKLIAVAKSNLDASKDIPAADEALKAAQKIWPSNDDFIRHVKVLETVNATFNTLVKEIAVNVTTDLASSESKFERIRAMKPLDPNVVESGKLIVVEQTLQKRMDGLATLVNALNAKTDGVELTKPFNDAKTELEACSAVRKDKRIDAARTQFDAKFDEHKKVVLTNAVGQLNGDFQKLGKYGDGSIYAAFEKRLGEVATTAPQDSRVTSLQGTFTAKKTAAEEVSVFGYTRRLKSALEKFTAGDGTLKQLDELFTAGDKEFPKAFESARSVLEKGKADLKSKLNQATELIQAKKELDQAQEWILAIEKSYAGWPGLAEAKEGVAKLNADFAKDIESARTTLGSGGSIEGVDDVLKRSILLHSKDTAALGLKNDFDMRKERLATLIATASTLAKEANLDETDAELARLGKQFPSEQATAKVQQQLKEAREAVQKEVAEAEGLFLKNTEKGTFRKASEILARAIKRVPSDPKVLALENGRITRLDETTKSIKELQTILSDELTQQSELKAGTLLDKIELVEPNGTLRGKYDGLVKIRKDKQTKFVKTQEENKVNEVKKNTPKSEDPSGF